MALPKHCEVNKFPLPTAPLHQTRRNTEHDHTQRYSRIENASRKSDFFRAPAAREVSNGGFIIYDDAFLPILGSAPELDIILEKDYAFAHEAGVCLPALDEVWITSNQLKVAGKKKVAIGKIKRSGGPKSFVYEEIDLGVELANGAVNYRDGVLFCEQGSFTNPGGLVYVSPQPPYQPKTIISNYHGRWFNSVNDAVVHSDGSIWFTDPTYGYEQDIRPRPQLPSQIYRYDPATGDIRAVADGLLRPNGLCFSPDEKTMYITDTGAVHGTTGFEPHRAASIHAYDVDDRSGGPFLINKRLFAFADDGVPDGIKCDMKGNVYSGCGDGVHVWTPGGTLVGKIYVPGGCANFCFGPAGEMFLLNETKVWRAKLDDRTMGALLKI
jgi:gluconolactonase